MTALLALLWTLNVAPATAKPIVCDALLRGEKVVVVFGTADDPRDVRQHSRFVLERLTALGVRAHLVDSAWFPSRMRASFDPERNAWQITLPDGVRLDGDDIHAAYWRLDSGVRTHERYVSQNDSRAVIDSWLLGLPINWVNGKDAIDLHQTKPTQLALVADLGVALPRTLVTNDAAAALDFVRRFGDVIVKPVQGGYATREVTAATLAQIRGGALDLAPITLQENVRGLDIRIFCFDDDIHGIEIRSRTTDFRSDPTASFRPHAVPHALATQVRAIRRALKLRFSGMDFKLAADGRYVFLEANPSPMFIGFEELSGVPLTDHLIELLVR